MTSVCDLIIPARDERANVDPLFDALEPLRGADVRHVVVADNGSTDGTGDLAAARGAVVVHEPQRGYGAACLRAIAWIADQPEPPEVIAFLDADLADDPSALPRLLEPVRRGTADIAIGARLRQAEPGALSVVQRFGNGLACTLMTILAGRRYADLGPFRAVRWSTFRRLEMADRTWGWTVELQMKAALAGVPSVDVDVPYRTRRSGRSKISGTVRGVITAGWKIITTIIVLWWRRRRIRDRWRRSSGGG
jgi:glycosyltransferase involved in cell wall biosynthesis